MSPVTCLKWKWGGEEKILGEDTVYDGHSDNGSEAL